MLAISGINLAAFFATYLGDYDWVPAAVLFASWETLYMVFLSTAVSYLLGMPLAIILVTSEKGHILENLQLNQVLGSIVNAVRSLPFIILLILAIPFTRWVVGTSIGTVASIVPLSLAAIPFVARLVETSLKEIDWGLIEAALSMGASNWQIISKVLLPEAMPSVVLGVAITAINLVGYSAMAGVLGGGGLGTLAYYHGYMRYQTGIMWITVIVLIVIVQGIQMLGDKAAGRIINKRR
ncbi:methionine ABC transporter permease [Syntrophomonas wolfei]|mgnify:FL=1|uniref:ABC metal ion transporter, inner membrane subunit n=1 Tax=Syntrophomonas wolfei subsp. wolfei (strain DSM 2245B / Goettingen) TaxID=335541 RepID=Q0AU84_SYNWW|nr:methionine ABC transporter permease [Syntrophomonas wolfei]ABI69720.1 ABC metal ion transporter, inner membrane subunit [Syntrophomonas wolfei subsp. wolfei str. Goettingen G311]